MTEDRKNWKRAWCYFVGIGKIPVDAKKNEWCLHHKDPSLRSTDIVRYNEWRIEDLVPMLKAEHTSLHQKGRHHTGEARRKISEANKGKTISTETRRKISETQRGRKLTPETIAKRTETFRKNHPEKPKVKNPKPMEERGRFWITNGIENRRIADGDEIPTGWRRGRLGFKRRFSPKLGPMSEEHKKKISESMLGVKFTEEHRRHLSEAHSRK